MKSTIKLISLALVLAAQSFGLTAQNPSKEMLNKVDSIFSSHYMEKAPGGAFAVIKNGTVLLQKNIGLANIEYQVPIANKTVFNIASNSKQLTTLLALLLEEEGKLSFQDDIRKHLPALVELPHKVTIKQLTNHTHGLPNVDELARVKGTDRMTHDEVLKMLFNIKSFNFKPGDAHQYNNTGYVLLSHIIERVGRKPFEEQLKEKIFNKLGMNDSQAIGDYNKVIYNKAYSYSPKDEEQVYNPVKISTMGASGVYTTIDDLIKWSQNFLDTTNMFDKYLKKMQEPTVLNSGKVIEYGMGIQFENYKGVDIVFHGGGTESYRSYMVHAPKHHLSLVFVSNAGGFSGYDIIYSALEILLKEFIDHTERPYTPEDISVHEGTYELNPGTYYTVLVKKNELFIQVFGTTDEVMLPRSGPNSFEGPWAFSTITFRQDGFDLRWVDFSYHAKRVSPPIATPPPIDLHEFTGIFKNEEHNNIYQIVVVDNKLIAKLPNDDAIALDFYSKTGLYAKNSDFGKIDFMFNSSGKVAGFKLSRQNLANLIFVK